MIDEVNACLELCGAIAVFDHVRQLHLDKRVAGVSVKSTIFFTLWGFWNLYYYPALGQWLSVAAGAVLVLGNMLWLGSMFYFIKHPGGRGTPTTHEAPPNF